MNQADNAFIISPNPNFGNFSIYFSGETGLPFNFILTNTAGEIIFDEMISSPEISSNNFNFSWLPPGTYFARIISGKESYREKIVIIK